MNYRNENATPCSRNEDYVFSNCQTTAESSGCKRCGQINPVPNIRTPHRRSACHTRERSYNCKTDNGFLRSDTPIAMVYSPMQQWKDLYDPHTALYSGTIFKELDLPFYPTPCRRKEESHCQCR